MASMNEEIAPCRNGRCGYGRVIDWNCPAKGTVNRFHNFDCPHHPGPSPARRRHCTTCTCPKEER